MVEISSEREVFMPFFPLTRVTVHGIREVLGVVEGFDYADASTKLSVVGTKVGIPVWIYGVGFGGPGSTYQVVNCDVLDENKLIEILSKEKQTHESAWAKPN